MTSTTDLQQEANNDSDASGSDVDLPRVSRDDRTELNEHVSSYGENYKAHDDYQ